jgi:hypothetical protein
MAWAHSGWSMNGIRLPWKLVKMTSLGRAAKIPQGTRALRVSAVRMLVVRRRAP